MSLPSDNYILSRDATEADRLELQHRCMISCQGYYLHPDVSLPSTSARIAELGTGTTIWLREVALAYPAVECHGFDISDAMFPGQKDLPPNIQLHKADIKQPFEKRWLGGFDVVHIRLIQAAMRVEEWGPVLRNITTLLKPGGWLQWVEDDRPVAVRRNVRPVAPLGAAEKSLHGTPGQAEWQPPHLAHLSSLNRVVMPDDRSLAMNYGYMNLDSLMLNPEIGNLECVFGDGFVIDREDDGGKLRKAWATMGISAVRSMLKATGGSGGKFGVDGDDWSERSMKEIDMGAHWVSRATVFIGRKKL